MKMVRDHLSRSKFNRKKLKAHLKAVLAAGRSLLKLKSDGKAVSLLSKLLHFIEPQYFMIYDSRVARQLCRAESATVNTYVRLQLALWQLGFHKTAPIRGFGRYWRAAKRANCTPMRVIDCTFF